MALRASGGRTFRVLVSALTDPRLMLHQFSSSAITGCLREPLNELVELLGSRECRVGLESAQGPIVLMDDKGVELRLFDFDAFYALVDQEGHEYAVPDLSYHVIKEPVLLILGQFGP